MREKGGGRGPARPNHIPADRRPPLTPAKPRPNPPPTARRRLSGFDRSRPGETERDRGEAARDDDDNNVGGGRPEGQPTE